MKQIELNRQLLGLEDFLFGVGQVLQTRGGQEVTITKINASNLPFDKTQSLLEWANSVNLTELGAMTEELNALYNNLVMLNSVEDNLVPINNVEDNLSSINNVNSNISTINSVEDNLANIGIVANDSDEINSLASITIALNTLYNNIVAIQTNSNNITAINSLYSNMTALLGIYTNIIPNLTEILAVDTLASQVAQDKIDVAAMKLAVENIYDSFDDRFLGAKNSDPLVDNDGNALIDGALYFNSSVNALKVYSLDNTTWYTIPQIYLSGLLDVQLTSITTGDILTWNGSKWVNTRTPSFDSIKLNGGTGTSGAVSWNNTDLTLDIILNSNVTLQAGQETLLPCKNTTGSTILNGKVVMAVGTTGNSGQVLIGLHDGTKASARRVVGIATEDIANGSTGFVTIIGKVRGLNTTGSTYGETWLNNDILYVKSNGALTKVEPLDTELKMPIAFVLHAHTNGTLLVRTTGIDENHDRDLIATKIDKVTSTDNAIVRFDGVAGQVQNSSVVIDDSGNVGIGITPLYKLHIKAGTDKNLGIGTNINLSNGVVIASVNDANGANKGLELRGTNLTMTAPGASAFINFRTGNTETEAMKIDSSGNVGIGVTPSAWSSFSKAIDIGNSSFYATGASDVQMANNTYLNSDSNWIYKQNGYASAYYQLNGTHTWRIAPSGSAGNAITWNTIMQHDGVGLLINPSFTAIPSYVQCFNGSTNNSIYIQAHSTSGVNEAFQSIVAGVKKSAILSNGSFQSATNSYGSTSDIKLKENIVDTSPKLDKLMKVQVRNFNYIGQEDKQIGVIAQEIEQIFPSIVYETKDTKQVEVKDEETGEVKTETVETGEVTKNVKYSVIYMMMLKAMQEQQEIINDLKSRIEIMENK